MAAKRKKSVSPKAPARKKTGNASRPARAKKAEKKSGRKAAGPGAPKAAAKPQKASSAVRPMNPDSMPADVIEFLTAVDEYKRKNGRPFPSWSEILEIVKGLGYRKSA